MSSAKTLHLQWADGEIEAGTLIEALYEQEQTIAILRQHKNDYMDAAECTRKHLKAELAKLRAELERRVPDGFALVPVEPTPEMVSAAEEAHMPFGDMDIALRMAILSAPSAPATVPDAITMVEVMKAWEYAEDHPHKYLRGTTNWCAAVAYSLNQQRVAAPSAPKADDPVKQMLLEALEGMVEYFPEGSSDGECFSVDAARAAIAAARKGEGE